jgi:hypothetical protein
MSALSPIGSHDREVNRLAWLDLDGKTVEPRPFIKQDENGSSLKGRVKALKNAFYEKCSATTRARFAQLQSLVAKGKKLFAAVIMAVDPLAGVFRNTVFAGESQFVIFKGLVRFAEKTRIISVILLPLELIGIVKNAVGMTKACIKGSAIKACEKGLELIDSLGGLCFALEKGVQTVYSFAELTMSATATMACSALSAVGTVFSLATIGINAKQWYDSVQFEKRSILKYDEITNENFKEFVDKINVVGNSRLARLVGVSDGKKFKGRITAIYQRNAKPDQSAEAKENINGLMKALKTRITSKKFSHALKILVAVVSIVAAGILFFTPLAPLGYSLLVVCTLIGMAILIKEYRAEKNINNFLKSLAPDKCDEILEWKKKQKRIKQLKKDPVVAEWLREARKAEKRRCEKLQVASNS